jgi:hypothetical protein
MDSELLRKYIELYFKSALLKNQPAITRVPHRNTEVQRKQEQNNCLTIYFMKDPSFRNHVEINTHVSKKYIGHLLVSTSVKLRDSSSVCFRATKQTQISKYAELFNVQFTHFPKR